MSDQCGRCELRGKLHDCLREDCFQHDNWFALAIQEQLAEKDKEIERLKSRATCAYCGHVVECKSPFEKIEKMIDHMAVCEKHPVPKLIARAEKAEAENAALRESLKSTEEVWENTTNIDIEKAIKAISKAMEGK